MITATNLAERHGGLDHLVALLLIGGQIIGSAMPTPAQRSLPFDVLQATITARRGDDVLAPGPAVLLLVAYAVVLVAAAGIVIRRRRVA